jgi:hypothetical protein
VAPAITKFQLLGKKERAPAQGILAEEATFTADAEQRT